jgi:hypothetical protein
MPSRRRSRNKNLGNNLADVQRRLRNMERRPVRTKLQNRVVTTASIAVNAVTPDEVSFGTTVITDAGVNTIANPKDGLLVINETAGTTSVYSEEQKNYIQLPAVDDDARTVANGKNTIYYQSSEPSGGTYAVDDTWFDSDDGYKMYTWTGSVWSGFQLGNSAIAQISATKITAGSLAAGVIVTSNLSAGQITTGSLSSAVIATTALNANNITAGTISGITIQTSDIGTGRAIKISNEDDILFYTSNDEIGIITVVNTSQNGGTDDDTWSWTDAVVMAGLDGTVPTQGTAPYPFVAASGTGGTGVAGLFGNAGNYVLARPYGVELQGYVQTGGDVFQSLADRIDLASGYGETEGTIWRVEVNGPLVLSYNDDQGPLSEGAGPPTADGHTYGQIIFRYT